MSERLLTQTELAQQVHAAGTQLVLAVTGGGSPAIAALVGVPGASRSILAAVVPYAAEAMIEWLSARPDEFCSERTARAMAMVAYQKARHYAPDATTAGVACTASLASDRPKRGDHRAHFACQTADVTLVSTLILEKGRRSRADEESVVAAVLLNHVAQACGLEGRVAVPLAESERVETLRVAAPTEQQDLLAGRIRVLSTKGPVEPPQIVFPGAFNPLHDGHRRMAAVAEKMLGHPVAFEISVANVDKPPLDFIEIERRLGQFSREQAVWLTRAPTFVEKAALFPGATFVVGIDTLARIYQPRYYDDSPEAVTAAIDSIAQRGCRFLVFGRALDGQFQTLADLPLPTDLAKICQQVDEHAFRQDISSTELRHKQSGSE